MTAIEKLIKAIGEHLVYNGPCDDSDEDDGYCNDSECTYCAMARAFDGYRDNPKPWAPPWPMEIPDWPEVWLAVDADCEGLWSSTEPDDTGRDRSWGRYDECESAGYFEIPPGVDWREMKVRVR